MFPEKNHQAAFQRGRSATNKVVHRYFERIYAIPKDFPLIADDDPLRESKGKILASLERAHGEYQGTLPWLLLNRIADALVNRSGETATIVSPQMVEESDQPLLLDAVIHALEATSRVNLDLMRRTSQAGGLIYSHSHDCDDCGITANIETAPLDESQIARFGANFVSQVFASIETIRENLPYKMLETCCTIPADKRLQ